MHWITRMALGPFYLPKPSAAALRSNGSQKSRSLTLLLSRQRFLRATRARSVYLTERKRKQCFVFHPSIHVSTKCIRPTFLRPSLPLPVWMASIRLPCRDVSFSTLLQTTGLNFLTGPKTEPSGAPEATLLSVSVNEVWTFPWILRLVLVLAMSTVFWRWNVKCYLTATTHQYFASSLYSHLSGPETRTCALWVIWQLNFEACHL